MLTAVNYTAYPPCRGKLLLVLTEAVGPTQVLKKITKRHKGCMRSMDISEHISSLYIWEQMPFVYENAAYRRYFSY